ncbi:MAG TPA: hypothetical protein VMH81_08670 [Bryobacteraceae bacterium]|nr:hypothetical protein [Bryobacteraceae bacterium]
MPAESAAPDGPDTRPFAAARASAMTVTGVRVLPGGGGSGQGAGVSGRVIVVMGKFSF